MKDLSAKIQLMGLLSYLYATLYYCDAFQPSSHSYIKSFSDGSKALMISVESRTKVNDFQQAPQRTFLSPLRMSSKDDNTDEVGNKNNPINLLYMLIKVFKSPLEY